MARPTYRGLEYFPLDTNLDDKFLLIEAKYGITGFGVIIKMLQKIYTNSYFYPWSEKEQLLFSKSTGVEVEDLIQIINDAVSFDIFSVPIYQKYHVLTSRGIQKRYFLSSKRRKEYDIYSEIMLIKPELNAKAKVNVCSLMQKQDNGVVNVCNNSINVCNNGEKEKEKEKEIGNMEKGNRNADIISVDNNPVNEFTFSVSPADDAGKRIDSLRVYWNDKGLIPMRRNIFNFTDIDRQSCIAIVSVYSDDEIKNAIDNYNDILNDKDRYSLPFPYQSFVGFMAKGVEKFFKAADPFSHFQKPGVRTAKDYEKYNHMELDEEGFPK
jgi:hypothetical protein